MAALNGALALDERDHGAPLVAEQLHFHVSRTPQAALEIDGAVTERRQRFGPRGTEARGELRRLFNEPHAFAAATGDGLQHERIADLVGEPRDLVRWHVHRQRLARSRYDRHARGLGDGSCGGLAAHRTDGVAARTDEGQSSGTARIRERRALGQESVPGVHGIGTRTLRHVHDGVDAKVGLSRGVTRKRPCLIGKPHVQRRAIAIRVDRDRSKPEIAARPDDADCDFASVGDEHLPDA